MAILRSNFFETFMKKLIWILMGFLSSCGFMHKDNSINLISYNIRFDNPLDGVNSWQFRKDNVAALLKFHDADIICFQEALYSQIVDIAERLPDFFWVGVGRDDGRKKGEFTPIFFKRDRFTLVDWGTFWLSETPSTPSLGWDAAIKRICTFALVRDNNSNEEFYIYNTHFDHIGSMAQVNSAKLIVNNINALSGEYPVILAGDFNVTPESDAYRTLTSILHDSWETTVQPPYGPIGTWNAFDYLSPLDKRIDYVFINSSFKVEKYANLTDSFNQNFPSDHLPVFVKLFFLNN
jgi:endonuclease/exonuclease/phosphatase family metal-dependent hydrolase